jgi:hypothetical protein
MTPIVFLACPRYGDVTWESTAGIMTATQYAEVIAKPNMSSMLTDNFNSLWCEALNLRHTRGLTHFAMIHSDVGPEPGWLDTLLAELMAVKADVLSVVLPLKDDRGLTSTGLIRKGTNHIRRFTLNEIYCDLPETFTTDDVPHDDEEVLAINTGLWVCDFTHPWVEHIAFKVWTRIIKDGNGVFHNVCLTEDWDFSFQCAGLGLTVAATRLVKATHYGRTTYSNDRIWGTWCYDEGNK